MKARHGLSASSKMLARYSHLNQDDLDDSYLGAIVAKVPETKEQDRSLVTCGKCQTVNAPETDLCISCQLPLTLQTAIMMDDKTAHDKEAFIADIMPNVMQKIRDEFKVTEKEVDTMNSEQLKNLVKNFLVGNLI
jgi:hypothetical protein